MNCMLDQKSCTQHFEMSTLAPLGSCTNVGTLGIGASNAVSADLRQAATASLQSVPAWRIFGSGATHLPSGMMQGGTASVQDFKQTFAGAPLPHSYSNTLLLQQAYVES